MDSGRYFWRVRLASCLKRMPDFAVTSSKTGGVAGAGVTPSNLAAGAAARAVSRNDRRLIFEVKVSLFSANRGRGFPKELGIFLCNARIPQPRVDLSYPAVHLKNHHSSPLRPP